MYQVGANTGYLHWLSNKKTFLFVFGLANDIMLSFIFIICKEHLDLLQRIGWIYFLSAILAL